MRQGDVHLRRESCQRFVEVVHLNKNADGRQDHENVSGGVSELVMPGKSELHRNAEGLDGHDGDGSNGRADREVDQRVFLAVNGRNLVDHDAGVHNNHEAVEKIP